MQGGRVTDDQDRRILVCYLDEQMGDFIFDKNNPFFLSKADGTEYVVPYKDDIEDYRENIETLDLNSGPNVFGLHANADIIQQTNASKEILTNMLAMQSGEAGEGGAGNKDEFIENAANDILSKITDKYE